MNTTQPHPDQRQSIQAMRGVRGLLESKEQIMNESIPEVPVMGHNNPPSPFEDAQTKIENLYGEAKHWLGGDPIDSEELAEGVTDLLNQLRAAGKEAETLRVEEKKPHDTAAKAVQAKFKPLSDMVGLATDAAKKALQPWLVKKAEEKAAEDARLQAKADEAAQREREAGEKARGDDLGDQQALLEAEEASNKAKAIAKHAENKSSGMKVGGAKAISLRTSYEPELTDGPAAAEHYWKTKRASMEGFLLSLASDDVRAGKHTIPGFIVHERKSVA